MSYVDNQIPTREDIDGVPRTSSRAGTDVHPIYYDKYSLATFLVEGTLFRAPRIFFEEKSVVFKDMFMLPLGEDINKSVEGTSDSKPIHLEGVQKVAFAAFLELVVPLAPMDTVRLEKAEWVGVLRLSSLWEFKAIKELAIQRLESLELDVIERIQLGHKYDIRQWIRPAYIELLKRSSPPTLKEADQLGIGFIFKVFQAREALMKGRGIWIGLRAKEDNLETRSVSYDEILADVFGENLDSILPSF